MSIQFRVFGVPAPQGSKRGFVRGGRVRLVEMSRGLEPWREAIVSQIIRDGYNGTLLDGPLMVRATFIFTRPKAHFGVKNGVPYVKDNAPYHKVTAPDLDKLCRSLGDALTQSGLIVDDDRIVRWESEKVYGDRPGVRVEVMPALVF